MVAGENNIHYSIDDGLLVRDNDDIAGVSAKKAPTKIETVKHAIFIDEEEKKKMVKAIKIAKKCLRIVYENIYFAIGIKVICLILGAVGIANMWLAIFADVGVMVIAVLNAIRALFVKKL